ncbi:PIN domain-containing protein [Desulfuromonas versatilis]|uniref:PIN domain-containing protein n=1 Tax=Desulfuromonas versatilis TaxID=2802975 RepID=A0ABN6DZY8_9BACT|nr:putative toxin-antitoxin system toxin component, PIN family [Desulfuromonas versatilis]BCR05620.1 PIN domain-containing protein [Desulfuromonas versatilis]
MRIVLDTNVFISGIFFSGPPNRILQGWRDGRVQLVLTPEIFEEYQRVAAVLHEKFPAVDLTGLLDLVVVEAEMFQAQPLPESVSADPDDDKFIACALSSGSRLIVSGDKHLLDVDGYREIEILKPRPFVDRYLAD